MKAALELVEAGFEWDEGVPELVDGDFKWEEGAMSRSRPVLSEKKASLARRWRF